MDGSKGVPLRCRCSRMPATTVFRAIPVASATTAMPPRPKAMASEPAHKRRILSSINGRSASNFCLTKPTSPMRQAQHESI
jgi:hypothetical protein